MEAGEGAGGGPNGPKRRKRSWLALVGIAAQYMWPDSFGLQARMRGCQARSFLLGLPMICAAPDRTRTSVHAHAHECAARCVRRACRAAAPPATLHAAARPQVRAWVCVALVVVLRLLNLAVPILYKKARPAACW